jgi:hypothetical protein
MPHDNEMHWTNIVAYRAEHVANVALTALQGVSEGAAH